MAARRRANPFAVLEEEEDFALPRSILASSASASSSSAALPAPPLAPAGAPATLHDWRASSTPAAPAGAPSSLHDWKSGGLSLAAVADELARGGEEGGPAPPSAASAFDFGSLASATSATEAQIAADAAAAAAASAAKADAMSAHLAAVHAAQKDELRERVAKLDLSHAGRARKLAGMARGGEYAERQESKVMRRNDARKRLNKAKHIY
jgi:hypothetical protein